RARMQRAWTKYLQSRSKKRDKNRSHARHPITPGACTRKGDRPKNCTADSTVRAVIARKFRSEMSAYRLIFSPIARADMSWLNAIHEPRLPKRSGEMITAFAANLIFMVETAQARGDPACRAENADARHRRTVARAPHCRPALVGHSADRRPAAGVVVQHFGTRLWRPNHRGPGARPVRGQRRFRYRGAIARRGLHLVCRLRRRSTRADSRKCRRPWARRRD